ncbi:MAG: exo-rhamnogalacturonan lyase family protein [Armatimonadota bacterium]
MREMWPLRLMIAETSGIDRPSEPVLGGVPLARGVQHGGGWFSLQRDGQAFLLEGTPAAYWPDGSVKWLHLCGPVDLPGGRQNAFTLTPASNGPPAGLRLTDDGRGVEIAGGMLNVRVAADPRLVLAVQDADGVALLQGPGLSARLRLTGPDGSAQPAVSWSFDPEAVQVVVWTANRVVIKLSGRFHKGDRTVAELLLFIEVLRESPRLGLEPVFIYLGDPDRDLIAELSLTAHTIYRGSGARYGFANEQGRGYRDVLQPYEAGPSWPQARQVQLGSTFYRTDKRTSAAGSWTKVCEGQRSQGWCHLGTAAGGVTAGMRYFWQEYPRALSLDTDAGAITFELIPPAAEPLDLRRYSPLYWGKAVYEYGKEGTPFEAQWKGATGIAKASELMLHFHPSGDTRTAEVGLAFSHPALLVTDPEQAFATGVFGPVDAAQAERPQESRLAVLVDFIVNEREVRGWYGLMHFGDVLMSYYRAWDRWAFDDGGYAWINTESLPDLGLWLAALRHGRADWLRAAVEMTRHNRDVDVYHRGNFRGVGTRHNVNHWGCGDKEWRVSMPLVRRLHYYLTGDPWTREVIESTIEVYQQYDRTSATAPSMSSALAGLMVKCELTGEAADLQAFRNMTDIYARAVREDGHFVKALHVNIATGEGEPIFDDRTMDGSYFFLATFGAQHTLVEAAELLDHPQLKQAIIRHADLCLSNVANPPETLHYAALGASLPLVACAFRWTGEERYREAIAAELEKPLDWLELETLGGDDPLDEPRHLALKRAERRNKIVCSIGNLLHLYPYGLAVVPEVVRP